MKTKEEAFLIHYLHYTVGFGREAAWGSKKRCSHFILRLLYLVIFVRILRHKLYGSTLDWVGYTCDERNMNKGQVFTFSDAGVRKKMDIGKVFIFLSIWRTKKMNKDQLSII